MAAHAADESQPKPVLTRAAIVTVIAMLAAALTKLGLGQVADSLTKLEDPISGLILAAGPLYTAIISQRHVTPVASPKDNAGNKLVPAGSAAADLDASLALAEADAEFPADTETAEV